MQKPKNIYRKNTIIWSVMQGALDRWPDSGWADLTPRQIAEVLGTRLGTVQGAIYRIEKETKYKIPCADARRTEYLDGKQRGENG